MMLLLSFYQGNNYTTADNAEYARPAYPVRKCIAQEHADEYRVDDIGITKDGNDAGFIRAV